MSSSLSDPRMIATLPREQCIALLRGAHIGRVAATIGADHRTLIRPVSYAYDCARGGIVFRSMPGSKLHALLGGRHACFEIDGADDDSVWSVIVRGRAEAEARAPEVARLEALGVSPAIATGAGGRWIRLRAETITGRRFSV